MNRLNYRLILLALIIAFSVASASENLTVSFLDVGQGDAELLQFNGHNVLIDGSTQDMGSRVECYLNEYGVKDIDLVVATHPHEDHIGGLTTILNDLTVRQVLDSGQTHTAPSFETYLDLIDRKNIPFAVAERGQHIDLDPGLTIEVLSPPITHFINNLNENSVVLKVTYDKVSFLFMGDAGTEAEDSLLASGYNLDADVLKVGHHGSSSGSSRAFLNAVTPAVSVIEVGTGNDYGHPTSKTLAALKSTGSAIYRTDLDGNIVVTTDGEGITVTTGRSSCSGIAPAVPAITSTQATPTAMAASLDGPFVGSSKSDKYHYATCSAAKKIKSSNLVTFSSSAEARAAGYVPCGICHPP
jgi:beta-lactamase superfamily II metal-dependent hydrolase